MKYSILFFVVYFLHGCMAVKANPLDSVKITKQKGISFIIHKVDKGEGLIALARRYNTTVEDILKANPKLKQLNIGQKINIPISPTFTKSEKIAADTTKITLDESHANADSKELNLYRTHLVQPGETLTKIAARYKVNIQQVIKWNGIKNNKIEIGQQLIVSGNVSMKSFEKWNSLNSLSAKEEAPKNYLSSSKNLIEETGIATLSLLNTHPTLALGSFVLCSNPETKKQILIQIEQTAQLPPGINISLNDEMLKSLGLTADSNRITIKYNQP